MYPGNSKTVSSGDSMADCQLYSPQETHRPLQLAKWTRSLGSGPKLREQARDRLGVYMADCPSDVQSLDTGIVGFSKAPFAAHDPWRAAGLSDTQPVISL